MSEDLWGDFIPHEEENEILDHLNKYVDALEEKTGGRISAKIENYIDEDDYVRYDFNIRSKRMNYNKMLMFIYHPITSKYPLTVRSFTFESHIICKDFEGFNAAVKQVLSGEVITQLLKNLLTFSK
ncbi:MAG: hypothetical protein JSU77_08705 [Fidelibacterota bacterium]|nr:MAG: hypothetical protein JSU77_08705 [Candidatus Neomarinimicrobiota bacterium]